MCGRWGWKWYFKINIIQFGIKPKMIISLGYDIASLMHWITELRFVLYVLPYFHIFVDCKISNFFQLKAIFKLL